LSAQRNTPDYSALLVMNSVLGGQFVSRVNLKLREEKGYTYGARTGFDWRRGLAPFSLSTSVHTAATADAIKDAYAEIDGLPQARPVTASELALSKASLTRGIPVTLKLRPRWPGGRSACTLRPAGYVFSRVHAESERRNSRRCHQVAAAYLDPGRLTTLVVGDHAAIRESMSRLMGMRWSSHRKCEMREMSLDGHARLILPPSRRMEVLDPPQENPDRGLDRGDQSGRAHCRSDCGHGRRDHLAGGD
jgi:hypothetical protein